MTVSIAVQIESVLRTFWETNTFPSSSIVSSYLIVLTPTYWRLPRLICLEKPHAAFATAQRQLHPPRPMKGAGAGTPLTLLTLEWPRTTR